MAVKGLRSPKTAQYEGPSKLRHYFYYGMMDNDADITDFAIEVHFGLRLLYRVADHVTLSYFIPMLIRFRNCGTHGIMQ